MIEYVSNNKKFTVKIRPILAIYALGHHGNYVLTFYQNKNTERRNEFLSNLDNEFNIDASNTKLKALLIDSKMFTWRRVSSIRFVFKLNDYGKLQLL